MRAIQQEEIFSVFTLVSGSSKDAEWDKAKETKIPDYLIVVSGIANSKLK
jgi:hypothetical protein